MNKLLYFINFILLSVFSLNISAGNVEKGKEKSAACITCHGDAGVSVNAAWPKLAGQHASYIASQLYEFQKGTNGKRNNAVMHGIALTLSNTDIEDLSAYYASLDNSIGVTDDKYVTLGQSIYRGGNLEYKIQACISCHGPNGQGNLPAAIPSLSGQHSTYIYTQLKNFQSKKRSNDPNKMMRNIVYRMSEDEMKAVSEYIEGLH
jgi:cytochrome c553